MGTVAACILIFLGIRYISAIAIAAQWLYDLVKPLLIGTLLAMILSVPLDFIEKHLFRKKQTPRKVKARRPVAILLSLLFVIGIFVGIAVLVIPELTGAISIVVTSITGAMEQLAAMDSSADLSQIPLAQQLSILDSANQHNDSGRNRQRSGRCRQLSAGWHRGLCIFHLRVG